MNNKLNRRHFIAAAGITIGTSASLLADDKIDPEVAAELKRRMEFLSPPDGIASDIDTRPSPKVEPFRTDLFVPTVARPLINLTDVKLWIVKEKADGTPCFINLKPLTPAGLANFEVQQFLKNWLARLVRENAISANELEHLKDQDKAWLVAFYVQFQKLTKRMLDKGIDIGSFPLVSAHQRFFDFKPIKFYAIWEMEFQWKSSDANCKSGTNYNGQELKGAKWENGSWSWGFAQLDQSADGLNPGKRDRPQGVKLSKAVFEAMCPGPTFKAKYNEPIFVRRINRLPEILDDDHTWIDAGDGTPRRNIQFALPSTTTHLHNAHTASESDGHPNDWINPGEYWDHHYGNFPSGYDNREKLSTLWYHDHRMDFTASNVYAGLDGFYFLFDEEAKLESDLGDCEITPAKEKKCLETQSADLNDEAHGWQLPAREHDIPLIFHDLLFDEDKNGDAQLVFDGFNTDGILGDRYTVNRVIQPNFKVKRRKYRFRLLNGGPSRFY